MAMSGPGHVHPIAGQIGAHHRQEQPRRIVVGEAGESFEDVVRALLARTDAHPVLAEVQERKPQGDAVDATPLGVVAQHHLAHGLAERVDVGGIGRRRLVQRIARIRRLGGHRPAIDVGADQLQRAGEHDLADASLGCTLEHVLVHRDVVVEDELWRSAPDTRVIAEVQQHVDALEQFERADVVEEVSAHEAVRHVVGVDDVGGEQIEALAVKERRHRATEPSGCTRDEHPWSVRHTARRHRSTSTTVRQTGCDTLEEPSTRFGIPVTASMSNRTSVLLSWLAARSAPPDGCTAKFLGVRPPLGR